MIPDEIKNKLLETENHYKDAFMRVWQDGGNSNELMASVENCISDTYSLAEQRISELEEWKRRAIEVMPDFQEIGKLINVKLGEPIHDKIIPFIQSQSETIQKLREGLEDLYLSIVDKSFYNSHATAVTNAKQLLEQTKQ